MKICHRCGVRGFFLVALLFAMAPSSGLCASTPFIIEASVLADPTGDLTISDVSGPAFSNQFSPISLPASLGTDDAAYWLRLRLEFPPETLSEQWTLDLQWDFLRSLALYIPPAPAATFAQGDWSIFIDSALNLPAPDGKDLVCYIRAVGYGGLSLNPILVSAKQDSDAGAARTWLLGMFFGLLASMFIYNVFLLFSLKDSSYLWYVLHIVFVSWYYLAFNGLAPDMPGADPKEIFSRNIHVVMACAALMFMSMVMFTRTFLMTKQESPLTDKILISQLILCVVIFMLNFFVSATSATVFGPIMGMTTAVVTLWSSVVRLAQGFKPARVFVPGWLVYISFGFIHSMTWAGLLPATTFTVYAPEIGTSVEVMVMSLALVYRVRLLRKEKAAIEREKNHFAEKNALFTMLLDSSKLGIGLVKDGAFSWANKQLQLMLGKNNRLKGAPLEEISGLPELLENSNGLSQGEGVEREGTISVQGRSKDVRALGQNVEDPSSEGTVWVVEDISEQKRLERLKKDVDQIMRHDLKNPLATISGLQSVMEKVGPLNARQKKLCAMIGNAAASGLQSLNTTLALYRIEAGSYDCGLKDVDLLCAMNDARDELSYYFRDSSYALWVTGQEALEGQFLVKGENNLLRAMLVNLIKNALEAMPEGGEITTRIEPGEDCLWVRITNPGEVPETVRERFFEKFVTSGKSHGAGLGTYSARLIARAFGGDIALDASKPGFTTVILRLKRA